MPKRKRHDIDSRHQSDDDNSTTIHTVPHAQRKRLEEKLHHGKKVLHRALKVAKGFERQKLGRRRQTAVKGQSQEEIERLDGEIQALKVGPHDVQAHG